MAITKVGAMTDPPVAGDYAILQAKLDAYAKQIGNQGMILTQWTNTITAPKIAMGSYITHGGTLFIVDTEDYVVPAPAGDGTYYLKVATSGATLALSWVASTAGYTWNAIYNGLYHSDESQILPYQLVKAGATLTKRKITNLMQGSGFVTVDWTGAMQSVYFDQGVKTTDSPTFVNVHSKVNDAQFYTGGAKKAIIFTGSRTKGTWYTDLLPYFPSVGDSIFANGWIIENSTKSIISHLTRESDAIRVYCFDVVGGSAYAPGLFSGSSSVINAVIVL